MTQLEISHHKLVPLVPEFLWLVLENPRSDCFNGLEVDGLFNAYIRLLRIHGLIQKGCVFYKRTYYYFLTVKGKRLLKSHVCRKCREVWCSVETCHDALSTVSECPRLNILIRRKKADVSYEQKKRAVPTKSRFKRKTKTANVYVVKKE